MFGSPKEQLGHLTWRRLIDLFRLLRSLIRTESLEEESMSPGFITTTIAEARIARIAITMRSSIRVKLL